MWFLQADIMIRMLAACLLMAALSFVVRRFAGRRAQKLIIVLDALIIGYVDWKLLVFYALYSLSKLLLFGLYNPNCFFSLTFSHYKIGKKRKTHNSY